MKEIVEILTKNNETIATMESCTGGYIANEITNIDLSSLCPGSVVYDIATGNVYILNSSFEWIKQ